MLFEMDNAIVKKYNFYNHDYTRYDYILEI